MYTFSSKEQKTDIKILDYFTVYDSPSNLSLVATIVVSIGLKIKFFKALKFVSSLTHFPASQSKPRVYELRQFLLITHAEWLEPLHYSGKRAQFLQM
jgi:hypothetical protein